MMTDFEVQKQELKDRVMSYVMDVKLKKKVAGNKERQMVRRFLKDYEQVDDEEYPYFVDWEELLKVWYWAKSFKHRKGVIAGQPILLDDFQLFILLNVFCFKYKKTGYKRFREAYIQLARKNSKSLLLSVMTSYVAFLSGEAEECYITGYSKDQSNLVYDEIVGQIDACSMLKDKYSSSYNRVKVHKNDSIIKALSRESRRFGDGTNPSFVVVDKLIVA